MCCSRPRNVPGGEEDAVYPSAVFTSPGGFGGPGNSQFPLSLSTRASSCQLNLPCRSLTCAGSNPPIKQTGSCLLLHGRVARTSRLSPASADAPTQEPERVCVASVGGNSPYLWAAGKHLDSQAILSPNRGRGGLRGIIIVSCPPTAPHPDPPPASRSTCYTCQPC